MYASILCRNDNTNWLMSQKGKHNLGLGHFYPIVNLPGPTWLSHSGQHSLVFIVIEMLNKDCSAAKGPRCAGLLVNPTLGPEPRRSPLNPRKKLVHSYLGLNPVAQKVRATRGLRIRSNHARAEDFFTMPANIKLWHYRCFNSNNNNINNINNNKYRCLVWD